MGRRASRFGISGIQRARLAWLAAAVAVVVVALASWPFMPAGEAGDGVGVEVDVAIVLAVDCSYSVDGGEFHQQMTGLAEAFRSPEVLAVISAGARKRIAVALVQWSGVKSQVVVVPWRVIGNDERAFALAAEIEAAPRATADGATSVSGAIDAGVVLHLRAPVRTGRRVIDISADGYNNSGAAAHVARDRAVAAGITINALAILTQYDYLHHWFRNHVTGGPGAFVEVADDYSAYAAAIRRKLVQEIAGPIT
ncbi:MAG: DUF1194 domain-containing protein [Rhizobiales bacterium]|nr:DUF1194 domain-containing protein [Hyphomicrobiales bacterium]